MAGGRAPSWDETTLTATPMPEHLHEGTHGAPERPLDASASARPSAAPDSLVARLLPKLVLSLVLGALFAWLVAKGGVPLIPSADAFLEVKAWTVPAYVGTLLVTHYFRASRWRFLVAPIKPLPLREVVALNWIGFFAIFALPLRLGELARPALTKVRHGISVSAGIGTIAVERVIDGLLTSLCVAFGLFAIPRLPPVDAFAHVLPTYGYVALVVFSGAFVALSLFLWQRDLAVRLVERTAGLVSPKLASFVAAKVGGVADGVRSIGQAHLLGYFMFETALYWMSNAGGMWLLGWGCGLPLGFEHAVAIMGILAIGILLPAGPGLFGNFQLAVSAALKLYFVESLVGHQGSVYIFLMYSIQAVVITVAGLVPLYVMKIPFSSLLRPVRLEDTAPSDR